MMFDDRRQNRCRSQLSFGPEWVRRLLDTPAVIAPRDDDVDGFPQVLADLAGPQRPLRIKSKLPHLPQSIRVNFGPATRLADKRIVLRDAIILAGSRMIHIYSQDRTRQIAEVL